MASVVEVHDRMLLQLHMTNAQLAQEKSEVDLKLRQATALLSELQSVWMDLPPKYAESIHKVLASQDRGKKESQKDTRESQGPTNAQKQWSWLSFSMQDLFGCTILPRQSIPAVEVPRTPPRPLRVKLALRPPSPPPPSTCASLASSVEPSPRTWNNPSCTPETGGCGNLVRDPLMMREGSSLQELRANNVPDVTCDSPGVSTLELQASNISDVICDSPGVSTLVGEIDTLCWAMKSSVERCHQELEERLAALKAETKRAQERLSESFRRALEAQQSELALCKLQLAEISQVVAPRFSLSADPQLELCDAEWNWCQRIAESRAKAGQDHAEWLENCLTQRFQSVEELLVARDQEFKQNLAMLWERKSLLAARLRLRTSCCGTGGTGGSPCAEATGSPASDELSQLKKALGDMEISALAPLRDLAASQEREEHALVKRLKETITDARSHSEVAVEHLSGFARLCKAELSSRLGGANAAVLARGKLERRLIIAVAFSTWVAHHFKLRLSVVEAQGRLAAAGPKVSRTRSALTLGVASGRCLKVSRYDADAVLVAIFAAAEDRAALALIFGSWARNLLGLRLKTVQEKLEAEQTKTRQISTCLQTARVTSCRQARRCATRALLAATLRGWQVSAVSHTVRTHAEKCVGKLRMQVAQMLDEFSGAEVALSQCDIPSRGCAILESDALATGCPAYVSDSTD